SSNNVLGNLTPADPQCIHRRNINPGEPVPYHLHNFDTGCDPDVGTVSKDNIPVVKNGITRVVSYYDHDIKGSCRKAPADRQSDAQQDGGSVQWYDADYGYIMGSWSPVALSSFVGPLCNQGPHSSLRFARGWVIAPANLPVQRRVYGYVALSGRLEVGSPNL